MRFDVLTLFPESFESFLSTSIIGRAIQEKKIEVNLFNIRDFSEDKHKKVDDVPFGGGAGMVMTCQPLFSAIEHVKKLEKDTAPVIFFTPHGETFRQETTEEFVEQKKCSRVILLCGHYEGIDQRVREALVTREISLGDFVLTGGELPAQVFIDAVSRLIPGVLGADESSQEESFSPALERKLEYPHYTRPAEFRGMNVPEVLLSGHHKNIEEWRKSQCKMPNGKGKRKS
ncbi:tRNA (guanosine(37)-N1)-methyltransferase TrmD [Candidatus Gracilibacteria bacterium]|nr:tRNA (guanosine(37)-N1)-methyltransferase TrmD [Candidatus Gracilibacteria bacterium]